MCSTLATACDNGTGTPACGPLTAATHGDLADELLVPSRVSAVRARRLPLAREGNSVGADAARAHNAGRVNPYACLDLVQFLTDHEDRPGTVIRSSLIALLWDARGAVGRQTDDGTI